MVIKSHIDQAFTRLLRPLVRMLLRHGVAYGELSEVVKAVYVDVAREEFTPRGKRPTDARVATLTGLTRKDVKRLREAPSAADADTSGEGTSGRVNRATRVLSGWYQDVDFCGSDGRPRPLSLDGDASFAALVRRYSGDIPSRTMLEELQRVHAVEQAADGTVHVISRSYLPDEGDPAGLHELGTAVHDLAATVEHNLDPERRGPRYFQRTLANERVAVRALPVFRRRAAEHSQQLLETLDDWLVAHEASAAQGSKDDQMRAGIGVYYFQEESQPKDRGSEET